MGERDKTEIEQFKPCIEAEREWQGGRKSSLQSSSWVSPQAPFLGEQSAGKAVVQHWQAKASPPSLDKVRASCLPWLPPPALEQPLALQIQGALPSMAEQCQ